MTDPSDDDFAGLHDAWRRGEATVADLYAALRDPMRRAARRSIRAILGERPDEEDVDRALLKAFNTLLEKGPEEVKSSLRGYAAAIARYRGMDRARWRVRERERIKQTKWQLEAVTPSVTDEDDNERRERLFEHLEGCLEALSPAQRSLVEEVIQKQVSLSDWASGRGTSYEAGRRMRIRALEALRQCVDAKVTTDMEEEIGE